MKCKSLGLWILFTLVMVSCPAFAQGGASADPIFSKLAEKAGIIGMGLRDTGYVIAGLALAAFTVMAIFNKLSWKNLAYIMVSCFILSVMVAAIGYFSEGKSYETLNFEDSNSGSGSVNTGTNVKENTVEK